MDTLNRELINEYKESWPLICDEWIDDGLFLWFSYLHQNGLYRLKKGERSAEFVSNFPNQERMGFRLYKSIAETHNKLVFAPGSATEIAIYDKTNGSIKMIPFDLKVCQRKNWCMECSKFWSAMAYDGFVYLFGRGYPGIICLNVDTYEIDYIIKWVNDVETITDKESRQGYLYNGVKVGDEVYFGLNCSDALFSFSLKTQEYTLHELGTGINGFKGIAFDGNAIWITPSFQDNVVRYDIKSSHSLVVDVSEHIDRDASGSPFATPVVLGNSIMVFPMMGKHVLMIDRQSLSVTKCDELQSLFETPKRSVIGSLDGMNASEVLDDNRILFINGNDASWVMFSLENGIEKRFHVTADKNQSMKICSRLIFEQQWGKKSFWNEGEVHSLDCFCSYLGCERE